MTRVNTLAAPSIRSVLDWAAQRQISLTISALSSDGTWSNMRSQLLAFDGEQGLLSIVYPISPAHETPIEIPAGHKLGVSFRRGHKKCLLVCNVVMRHVETTTEGRPVDTLVLTSPTEIRELQRRAYQRVIVMPDRLIPVKLMQTGAPGEARESWPICAGRLANLSAGGLMIDIRADQNPRLSSGDTVGIEITCEPGKEPLTAEAQYRHCTLTAPGRLGLGLQFVGLEHGKTGPATLARIAELVAELRRIGGSDLPD